MDLRDQLQRTLGDAYTLERELGGGGMSRVFVAHDTRLGRKVVVKVLSPELAAEVSTERFEREIKLAAQLSHPNIVPLHAAGDSGGLPFYTMPFVEGLSLRSRLARDGALPAAEAVSILRDVARALAFAHEHGVVHRDIKPENVLFAGDAAVVTDFGIAKAISAARTLAPDGTLTQAGASLGTPMYMAPEQAMGEPDTDFRADLYAFGCLGYEMIAGEPPFTGRSVHEVINAHINTPPAPLMSRAPACPPALAALIMQCLEKDPARRPQSAREVLQALDAAGTPTGRTAPTAAGAARRTRWIAVAAAAVVLVAAGVWAIQQTRAAGSAAQSGAAVRSVAVLPFENTGGDTANAYFADGVAEELTTALSKVQGLRVAARSSAFRFRGNAVDVKQVGTALNVAAVLEGTVRRAGPRMRVTATLTGARDGLVLWSESYEREVKDVFAVQDEIARSIVGALRVQLTATGRGGASGAAPQPAELGTKNLEAYDLYLRGLFFLNQRGAGVARSITYFGQAIAKDSMFARAYAQQATALALLPLYAFGPPDPLLGRDRARIAAEHALRLDPSSAEAHAALGTAYQVVNEFAKAAQEFERAIALDPNYEFAPRAFAVGLWTLGRFDDAVAMGRKAAQIDPLSPTSLAVLSKTLQYTRQWDEAVRVGRRAVEIDSLSALARAVLALAEYFAGDRARAHDDAVHAVRLPQTSGAIGYVLAATDDHSRADSLAKQLEREWNTNAYAGNALGELYLGLGDTTRALAALERALPRREPVAFSESFAHPVYDAVRSSARFAAIVRAYGIDAAAIWRAVPAAKR